MVTEIRDCGVAELPDIGVDAWLGRDGLCKGRSAAQKQQNEKREYEHLRLHRSVAQGTNLTKFAE